MEELLPGMVKGNSCMVAVSTGIQRNASVSMFSDKNQNKTCCHDKSTDPRACDEANCGERGVSINTQTFFCAEHDIRHGAVPKKHLVLDAKPSVCFSFGST